MTETIKKYYKFLIKNFGNVSLAGCHDLAVVLACYDENDLLANAFTRAEEITHRTATAIEKACRLYLKMILNDYTQEDLSKFFDYEFSMSLSNTINLAEFIPIVKLYLEDNEPAE